MTEDLPDERMRVASEKLLAYIAAVRHRKIEEISADARRQCVLIITTARAQANARLRAALAEERRRRREETLRAAGEADAEVWREENRLLEALLNAALSKLETKLNELWGDPAVQARWLATTLAAARARLSGGVWRLEHPSGWELRALPGADHLISGLGADIKLETRTAADIRGGLRLVQEGAVLDATLAVLFEDRKGLQAVLLGLLEQAPTWPGVRNESEDRGRHG